MQLVFHGGGGSGNHRVPRSHLRIVRQLCLTIAMALVAGETLAQTADLSGVPGEVVNYQLNATRRYFFSDPEIVVLPNGDYVASHALAGRDSNSGTSGTTSLFRSSDKGATWSSLGSLSNMLRGSLFVSGSALYLIGANKDTAGNNTQIRKSLDNGSTWTTPTGTTTGLFSSVGGPGTPTNPVVYGGRIWAGFTTSVYSAPVGSDLLNQANWTGSDAPPWNGYFGVSGPLWFEGQVMASSATGVVIMPKVRPESPPVNFTAKPPYAAVIGVTSPTTTTFDPATGFVPLPGGEKKFGGSYDAVSGKFYVLSNPVLSMYESGTVPELVRNTGAMLSSKDLTHWDVEKIFLYTSNVYQEGFQYFQFDYDGSDMVVASRTAFNIGGTMDRGHDSNLLTVHKIQNFRTAAPDQLLVADTANNQVLRYEATQYENAPLGSFALGASFSGAALDKPTDLAQAANGDVYVREQAGRILRFDALGNFISSVSSAPVAFQGTQLTSIVQPASGERAWTQAGSGNWNDIRNWYYWGRPDTNEEIANFGSAVLTSSTVTINEAVTMKGMRFQSDQQYTLSGSGAITIASSSGTGTISVQRGAHQTLVSLMLGTDTAASAIAGTSLAFKQAIDLNGKELRVTGAGLFSAEGGFDMNGGTLLLDGLSPFTFGAGSAAILDGVLHFDPDPILTIAAGRSFDLLDGTAYLSGQQFQSVILPPLSGGMTWDTTSLYSTGAVIVVPEPGGASLVGALALMLYVGHPVRRERSGADG